MSLYNHFRDVSDRTSSVRLTYVLRLLRLLHFKMLQSRIRRGAILNRCVGKSKQNATHLSQEAATP
jgi:hypothetical protein